MSSGPVENRQIFRVNIQFELGTSKCQTGYYVRDYGAQFANPGDILSDAITIADGPFRALLPSTDRVTGVDVLRLNDKLGASHSFASTAGTAGAVLATSSPSFNAVTISLRGERRTKYGHGRMFLPCRAEGWMDGDVVSDAGVTAFNAFIAAMTDEYVDVDASSTAILVNYHPAKPVRPTTRNGEPGPTLPAVPESYYDVTSIRLNRVVTSLGSRKLGRGA